MTSDVQCEGCRFGIIHYCSAPMAAPLTTETMRRAYEAACPDPVLPNVLVAAEAEIGRLLSLCRERQHVIAQLQLELEHCRRSHQS